MSQLPFIEFPGETLTVTASAEVNITAATLLETAYEVSGVGSQPRDVRRVTCHIISGGPVYFTTDGTAPTAAGTAGEHYGKSGDIITVSGLPSIKNLGFIVETGGPSTKINCIPAGVPRPSVN